MPVAFRLDLRHVCEYCLEDRENLCDRARFTGWTRLTAAMQSTPFATNDSVFGFPSLIAMLKRLPCYARDALATAAWSRPDQANVSGIMDSAAGAAAHIVAQVANYQEREIYAFTRPGDTKAQEFALSLGAVWAGPST